MLKHIIPGHVRAHTLWLGIILGVITYILTDSTLQTVGVVFLVAGMFIGDQATHLAQENHEGKQPTWIERQQQKYRWTFVFLGFVVAVSGLLMIL